MKDDGYSIEIEIQLIKRTLENNTHEVNEDKKIKRITSWRKSRKKFIKNLKYNILSFGLLHLFSLLYPTLYIKIYCIPAIVKESDYFLVENIYNQVKLCPINRLQDTSNKTIYKFEYKYMMYEYNVNNNTIIPVYMNLSEMKNEYIINTFYEGLYSKEIMEKAKLKYNKNEFNLNIKLYLYLFLNNQIPTYLIIVLIEFLEFLFLKNYTNLIFKLITECIFIFVQIIYLKINIINIYKKEFTLDNADKKLKVKRKYLSKKENKLYNIINYIDLLPGDILYLYNNDYVPCDGIIIEGECIVNDKELSGKIITYKKTALEYNDKKFDYKDNNINIIYHGMKILQIHSRMKQEYIIVLCINTGINTMKANQYTNILYLLARKKEYSVSYSFLGENKRIYLNMLLSVFTTIIAGFIIYGSYLQIYKKENVQKNIPNYIITILCKTVMTSFFILKNIIIFITSINLKKLNITCFEPSKLISTGKINTIILNKSVTLSENNLLIKSYNPVSLRSDRKDKIHLKYFTKEKSKDINSFLIEYYKNYLNNNIIKSKERSILFFECLLSCSNVEKYDLEYFGSNINIEIFKELNWNIKQYEELNNDIYLYDKYYIIKTIVDIYPNNYYKIFESIHENNIYKSQNDYTYDMNIISSLYNLNNIQIKKLFSSMGAGLYKIRIYKKFICNESLYSGAIIHNLLTNEFRFMIKGTSDELMNKCKKETVPNNIEKIMSLFRKKGLITVICASKLLNISEYKDINDLEYYMNDLIFCGLLTLENKVKSRIINSIQEIKKFNENILMISEDNEYNCLSIGYNCGLIENKNIFILDNENNQKITIKKILSIDNNEDNDLKNKGTSNISKAKTKFSINDENFFKFFPKNKRSINSDISFEKQTSEQVILKKKSYQGEDLYNNNYKRYLKSKKYNKKKDDKEKYDFDKSSTQTANKRLNFIEKNYFKKTYKEYEDVKNGLYCISGKLFNYLYINKSKIGSRQLLELIMKKCIILFNMSSIDKSLLVDYYRDNSDNTVCTIGQNDNDIDSLISSNVGISLKNPKNRNTILYHFYSSTKDILCIKAIIESGKFLYENIIILESISFIYSIIVNLYVFASMARDSPINKIQLDFLEIEFLIVLIASLFSKPNNENIRVINNPLLLNIYYIIISLGILIIKPANIKFFNFLHEGDHTLTIPFRNQEYLSFYFIICMEGIISTILALNLAPFYKRTTLENKFLIIVTLVYYIYMVLLLFLESSNISCDVLSITTFAYNEKLVDSFTDLNKKRAMIVVIFDLVSTILITLILKTIFRKIIR